MSTDNLAETIWETSRADEGTISAAGADIVTRAIRERFVVIDRDRVQHQVDTVIEHNDMSPYPDEDRWYPTIKSGPAHVQIRAGADHARDMAVHYLALAQWIDEHPPVPPVDEKAVEALADSLRATSALGYVGAGQLARRLVADGWKREAGS